MSKKQDRYLLYLINIIYIFLVSALGVVLPLYLIEKGFGPDEIGIIMAVSALSFMIFYILLGALAEKIGLRKIAFLYSFVNMAAILIYISAGTLSAFVSGSFLEGIRTGGFWSTIRAETMAVARKSSSVLAFFSSLRTFCDGAGKIAGGILLLYLSFHDTFLALLILSAVLVLIMLSRELIDIKDYRLDKQSIKRIFRKRPHSFWKTGILLAFLITVYNILIGFLLPVYFRNELAMSFGDIGLSLAAINILAAIASLVFIRLKTRKTLLLLIMSIIIPTLVFGPFISNLLIFIVLVAICLGVTNIFTEYLLFDHILRTRYVSLETALLFLPLRAIDFILLFAGGIIITVFGFYALFWILAAVSALFLILFNKWK
ncbi:MFS transporter [Candidatus Micrarchaeota archaeon]|nr:MFS transporter [Candidatus Micrarchaeota archaeon]